MPLPDFVSFVNEAEEKKYKNNLKLFCNLMGTFWTDVSDSTHIDINDGVARFTSNVSARFCLVRLKKDSINLVTLSKYLSTLYQQSSKIPVLARFAVFGKRNPPLERNESELNILCVTERDGSFDLQRNLGYQELANGPIVEVNDGTPITVTLSENFEILKVSKGSNRKIIVPSTTTASTSSLTTIQPSVTCRGTYTSRTSVPIRATDPQYSRKGSIRFSFRDDKGKMESKAKQRRSRGSSYYEDCILSFSLPDQTADMNTGRYRVQLPSQQSRVVSNVSKSKRNTKLRLTYIAEQLKSDWTKLAHLLNFNHDQIESIQSSFESPEEQALVFLQTWISQNRKNVDNSNKLERTLKKISRYDLVMADICVEEVDDVSADEELGERVGRRRDEAEADDEVRANRYDDQDRTEELICEGDRSKFVVDDYVAATSIITPTTTTDFNKIKFSGNKKIEYDDDIKFKKMEEVAVVGNDVIVKERTRPSSRNVVCTENTVLELTDVSRVSYQDDERCYDNDVHKTFDIQKERFIVTSYNNTAQSCNDMFDDDDKMTSFMRTDAGLAGAKRQETSYHDRVSSAEPTPSQINSTTTSTVIKVKNDENFRNVESEVDEGVIVKECIKAKTSYGVYNENYRDNDEEKEEEACVAVEGDLPSCRNETSMVVEDVAKSDCRVTDQFHQIMDSTAKNDDKSDDNNFFENFKNICETTEAVGDDEADRRSLMKVTKKDSVKLDADKDVVKVMKANERCSIVHTADTQNYEDNYVTERSDAIVNVVHHEDGRDAEASDVDDVGVYECSFVRRRCVDDSDDVIGSSDVIGDNNITEESKVKNITQNVEISPKVFNDNYNEKEGSVDMNRKQVGVIEEIHRLPLDREVQQKFRCSNDWQPASSSPNVACYMQDDHDYEKLDFSRTEEVNNFAAYYDDDDNEAVNDANVKVDDDDNNVGNKMADSKLDDVANGRNVHFDHVVIMSERVEPLFSNEEFRRYPSDQYKQNDLHRLDVKSGVIDDNIVLNTDANNWMGDDDLKVQVDHVSHNKCIHLGKRHSADQSESFEEFSAKKCFQMFGDEDDYKRCGGRCVENKVETVFQCEACSENMLQTMLDAIRVEAENVVDYKRCYDNIDRRDGGEGDGDADRYDDVIGEKNYRNDEMIDGNDATNIEITQTIIRPSNWEDEFNDNAAADDEAGSNGSDDVRDKNRRDNVGDDENLDVSSIEDAAAAAVGGMFVACKFKREGVDEKNGKMFVGESADVGGGHGVTRNNFASKVAADRDDLDERGRSVRVGRSKDEKKERNDPIQNYEYNINEKHDIRCNVHYSDVNDSEEAGCSKTVDNLRDIGMGKSHTSLNIQDAAAANYITIDTSAERCYRHAPKNDDDDEDNKIDYDGFNLSCDVVNYEVIRTVITAKQKTKCADGKYDGDDEDDDSPMNDMKIDIGNIRGYDNNVSRYEASEITIPKMLCADSSAEKTTDMICEMNDVEGQGDKFIGLRNDIVSKENENISVESEINNDLSYKFNTTKNDECHTNNLNIIEDYYAVVEETEGKQQQPSRQHDHPVIEEYDGASINLSELNDSIKGAGGHVCYKFDVSDADDDDGRICSYNCNYKKQTETFIHAITDPIIEHHENYVQRRSIQYSKLPFE